MSLSPWHLTFDFNRASIHGGGVFTFAFQHSRAILHIDCFILEVQKTAVQKGFCSRCANSARTVRSSLIVSRNFSITEQCLTMLNNASHSTSWTPFDSACGFHRRSLQVMVPRASWRWRMMILASSCSFAAKDRARQWRKDPQHWQEKLFKGCSFRKASSSGNDRDPLLFQFERAWTLTLSQQAARPFLRTYTTLSKDRRDKWVVVYKNCGLWPKSY